MASQVYRETYLAALEAAHAQLEQIIREFDNLQLRKELIDHVVGALEPFLPSAQPARYEVRHSEPVHHELRQPEPIPEPIHLAPEPEIVQPVLQAAPVPAPEPVAPPAFAPASESKMDPIQRRINRALGLAVA